MGRWSKVLVAAGLISLAFGGAALAQNDVQACTDKNMEPGAAIVACNRALAAPRLDPASKAKLIGVRGVWYVRTRQYDPAVKDLTAALAVYPREMQLYLARAVAWLEVGDLDRSLSDINQALALQPGNAEALHRRAYVYARKGDTDRALTDLDAVIKAAPTNANAFKDRAELWRNKKVLDRALADLDQAIRIDHRMKYLHYRRGVVLVEQKLYDRAISDFDTEIALSPEFAGSWRERGSARLRKGDARASIADFERATDLDPQDSDAWYQLGVARNRMNDPDRAIAAFDRASQGRSGRLPRYLTERGVAYQLKGDFDRALADQNEAVRLAPSAELSYRARALTLFRSGNLDRALADAVEAVRLEPRSYSALGLLCVIRVARAEHARALSDCEETLRLEPNSHSALGGRAMVFASRGEYRRALEDFDKAIGSQKRPRYLVHRGLAFEALGDRDRARRDFEAALSAEDAPSTEREALRTLARDKLAALVSTAAVTVPPRQEATINAPPPQTAALAPPPQVARPPQQAETRVALVIGNSQYRSVPALANPARDTAAVADALRRGGFQSVIVANDLSREAMIDTLRRFAATSANADWSVVYFAGHGIEVGGQNYVVPVDAKLQSDRDTQYEAITLEQMVGATEGARKLRMLLLDACRENPFINRMQRTVASRSIGRGLSQIEPDAGMLVVFAAKHGQIAFDGEGANSPFVSSLVRRMSTPQLEIRKMFDLVRDDVMAATGRKQQPFSYGSVPGNEDFYFTR